MNIFENSELILVNIIQQLTEKNKNIPELVELEVETKKIINQNCISLVQFTMLYLMESHHNINPETRERINRILQRIMSQ